MTELAGYSRSLIINARCKAMKGDTEAALTVLDEAAQRLETQANIESVVRVMSVRAELLFLDCREAEAIEVFNNHIEPQLSSVPRQTALAVGHNRNDVGMSVLDLRSGQQFYDLYDRARITGEKLFDAEATVYAFESAAEGKHYDALPAFWREVLETYRGGSWKYFRRASSRLAEEFLALGWIEGAGFHAILALDEGIAKQVAVHALARQDSRVIQSIIRSIVGSANLKRHSTVGCLVLSEMADAIPDSELPDVFQWLLNKASLTGATASELNLLKSAWDAITSIAERLTSEDASKVVEAATKHELWAAPNLWRKHLIAAVNESVGRLPSEELASIAERSMPLATTSKHDLDYAGSISLLCQVADRGGKELKETIGKTLYPTGVVNNAILMQVAEVFGRQLASEEQANEIGQRVANEIRNQVQRGNKDATGFGEGYGRITIGSENESISVSLSSLTGLRAVLNHRKLLSDESVSLLADAILEMVKEPENIPANKTALIDCLMTLEDRLTPNVANSVYEALAPIAKGIIPEPKIMKGTGDPNNPLNRFRANMGSFAQIQGQALHALAYLDELNEGKYGERLEPIFGTVLTSVDPEVRRAAFGALRWLTKLSEPTIMSLLLGTRDPETRTAEAAYVALARNKHLRIPDNLWHQLIYSLTMSSQSQISQLRRAAAFTLEALRNQSPNEIISEKIRALEEVLTGDICFSVRSVLLQKTAVGGTAKIESESTPE